MAAQAIPAVYVAGAALVAGAAWLMTPAGQRASQSLGSVMKNAASEAVDDIKSIFSSSKEKEKEKTKSETTTATSDAERKCDGPHRGRLQVQGYEKNADPYPIEHSWPWNRSCTPPLRPEGLAALSGLLAATSAISKKSAGIRTEAFIRMSQHIKKSPPPGFYARHVTGWNHLGDRAYGSGKDVPRVDLEVIKGRAFGDY